MADQNSGGDLNAALHESRQTAAALKAERDELRQQNEALQRQYASGGNNNQSEKGRAADFDFEISDDDVLDPQALKTNLKTWGKTLLEQAKEEALQKLRAEENERDQTRQAQARVDATLKKYAIYSDPDLGDLATDAFKARAMKAESFEELEDIAKSVAAKLSKGQASVDSRKAPDAPIAPTGGGAGLGDRAPKPNAFGDLKKRAAEMFQRSRQSQDAAG